MPKFNATPARLALCHAFFQNNPTAHSIKDLEKSLPTAAGISGMQVKDYLTALVDDNKIRVEKIGSGNWYWCFRGDEKKQKEREVEKWKAEETTLQTKIDGIIEAIDKEKQERGGSDDELKDGQLDMIKTINNLTEEKKQLQKEIAMFADNDPMEIERQKEFVQLLKVATNVWIDNIFAIDAYLKKMGLDKDTLASLKEQCGIAEDLDTV